jgi:8-oxo-dGTP pyrophosphatase MutT (NUDIX family)
MAWIERIETLLQNRFFQLRAKHTRLSEEPYYCVKEADYACAVAVDPQGRLLVVRQYRPAVECETLELPSGHVHQEEDPLAAAQRELLEETGHASPRWISLGPALFPDTGRLENRQWCFAAPGAVPVAEPRDLGENITFLRLHPGEVAAELEAGRFGHALHVAALFQAWRQGYLPEPEKWLKNGT